MSVSTVVIMTFVSTAFDALDRLNTWRNILVSASSWLHGAYGDDGLFSMLDRTFWLSVQYIIVIYLNYQK